MQYYLAVLGRQPELSLAELRGIFGDNSVHMKSNITAKISTTTAIDVQQLGGSPKIGKIIIELPHDDLRSLQRAVEKYYLNEWSNNEGKITLGVSAYDWKVTPKQLQVVGLGLKNVAKKAGRSLRLIPNQATALSTATSHHNKLGLAPNKIELLISRGRNGSLTIAQSIGAQNISALAARDQGRPKRDAFVGMLPPKLALTMINLVHPKPGSRILDPFCGTGVVLQEAALLGYNVYGTDLADKMIDYSTINLQWLTEKYKLSTEFKLHQGDAMTTTWQTPIGAVVAETYLGQPFSAPPHPEKLTQVRGNCNAIISDFLTNLASQLESGTPLCLAVPAWRDSDGGIARLPLISNLANFGYSLKNSSPLLYYRDDQVVARDILILTKD